jgi:hypothetical protein
MARYERDSRNWTHARHLPAKLQIILRPGRDMKTVANVWNPVLFCFTYVSDFVYQLEATIFIRVVKLWE